MDNLKGKIIGLIFSLLFFGCGNNHDIKEAEKIIGFKLSSKVKFEKKKEHWNDFNGNGFKILIYGFSDVNYFTVLNNSKKFNEFDFSNTDNPFSNSEVTEFIKGGQGFYKSINNEQESKSVIIDLENKKVIYYYISM